MVYQGYVPDHFEKKVILTVATTGGSTSKANNPSLPEQPDEIVEDVRECREAGASIVHLHARNPDGSRTKDLSVFQELMDRIEEECPDIIVNFTSAGRPFSREERIRPIVETRPNPEMASLDMGPLNYGKDGTSTHPRGLQEEFAAAMRECGTKPELELFNPGQLTEVYNLIDQGLLEKPYYCNFIFGMQTGTLPHPRNLQNFVDNMPADTEWTCMAIGRHQLPMTTMGLVLGGHIRVGMEDNVYYRKGELAESNAQLVRRAARLADELGRPIASPDEARAMLNID